MAPSGVAHAPEDVDPIEDYEARPKIACRAQFKRSQFASTATGGSYSVKFEIDPDVVPELVRAIRAKRPFEIVWLPDHMPGMRYTLGHGGHVNPSALSIDADGDPHQYLNLPLPMDDIGLGIGILAVGMKEFGKSGGPTGQLHLVMPPEEPNLGLE